MNDYKNTNNAKAIVILIAGALLCAMFLIPDKMGKAGVILVIARNIGVVIFGGLLMLLGCFSLRNKIKGTVGVAYIALGVMGMLCGIAMLPRGVKALQVGTIKVEGARYQLEYKNAYRGPKRYYVI